MNGYLLKNGEGVLGLAVVDEPRKVQKVVYHTDTKNLNVTFSNGDSETLPAQIAATYEPSLFKSKTIFVGHFTRDGLDKVPSDEYHVPLDR